EFLTIAHGSLELPVTVVAYKDLLPAREYAFELRARDTSNLALDSSPSTSILFNTALAEPQGEEVVQELSDASFNEYRLTLTWDAVEQADAYRVVLYQGDSNGVNLNYVTVDEARFVQGNLFPGQSYLVEVTALGNSGNYPESLPLSLSFDTDGEALPRLATPEFESVAEEPTRVAMVWGEVAGAESYQIKLFRGSRAVGDPVRDFEVMTTTAAINGIETGIEYTISLIALSDRTASSHSLEATHTFISRLPLINDLRVAENNAGQIVVVWDERLETTSYDQRVFPSGTISPSFTSPPSDRARASSTIPTVSLSAATEYTFEVIARRDNVDHSRMTATTFNTALPKAMLRSVNDQTASEIDVRWAAVDLGSIFEVSVYEGNSANGFFIERVRIATDLASHNIIDLLPGTDYTFHIVARDESGVYPDSAPLVVVGRTRGTPPARFETPHILSVKARTYDIAIQWLDTEQSAEYQVDLYLGGRADHVSTLSHTTVQTQHTFINLAEKTQYTIRVVALSSSTLVRSLQSTRSVSTLENDTQKPQIVNPMVPLASETSADGVTLSFFRALDPVRGAAQDCSALDNTCTSDELIYTLEIEDIGGDASFVSFATLGVQQIIFEPGQYEEQSNDRVSVTVNRVNASLTPLRNYRMTLSARDDSGNNADGVYAPIRIETIRPQLVRVNIVAAMLQGEADIALSWMPVGQSNVLIDPEEVSYTINYYPTANPALQQMVSGILMTDYVIEALNPVTAYTLEVSAQASSFTSSVETAATAMTQKRTLPTPSHETIRIEAGRDRVLVRWQ
ncbi:MAG: hypothetical protein ACNYNY_00670, partial [Candidatus Oxydemutatoraceae bacterium WSBS_2016_MAG_OTU14]